MSNAKIIRTHLPNIPGTKPATSNAQLLVSTGIPSLDHFIGGGLPVGSILLLEEDAFGIYSKIMFKYFIAEGIVSRHSIFIGSQDVSPSQILSDLPAPVEEESTQSSVKSNKSEEMKIAWRYQNMKVYDSSSNNISIFGHYYDLTKKMENMTMKNANIFQWSDEHVNSKSKFFDNETYMDLLLNIKKTIQNEKFFISQQVEKRNILRICLNSLGSRSWLSSTEDNTQKDLLKFLYLLRALMRESFTVAILTVPVLNFDDHTSGIVQRIEHLSDVVIGLESFAGSTKETNPVFKDYHGLLHIKKLPAFNTLVSHELLFTDLAFKLRRKKFLVEILHLPPELGETTQREQDEAPTLGCSGASSGQHKLDF